MNFKWNYVAFTLLYTHCGLMGQFFQMSPDGVSVGVNKNVIFLHICNWTLPPENKWFSTCFACVCVFVIFSHKLSRSIECQCRWYATKTVLSTSVQIRHSVKCEMFQMNVWSRHNVAMSNFNFPNWKFPNAELSNVKLSNYYIVDG
jgi:hypothetical protein